MSLLTDLLFELVDLSAWGIGPTTDRGIVATFTAGSLALTVGSMWLLATSPYPLGESWGLAALAGSVICGGAGLLVSVLHVLRVESERAFGVLCLLVNLAAVATPLLGMSIR